MMTPALEGLELPRPSAKALSETVAVPLVPRAYVISGRRAVGACAARRGDRSLVTGGR